MHGLPEHVNGKPTDVNPLHAEGFGDQDCVRQLHNGVGEPAGPDQLHSPGIVIRLAYALDVQRVYVAVVTTSILRWPPHCVWIDIDRRIEQRTVFLCPSRHFNAQGAIENNAMLSAELSEQTVIVRP